MKKLNKRYKKCTVKANLRKETIIYSVIIKSYILNKHRY